MKKVFEYLFWSAASVYLLYQLWSAFSLGVIRGRRANIFTFQEDPIFFVISVIICIALFGVVAVIGCHGIQRKVMQFGGNYNLNTFKAMARHALRKSN